MVKYYNLSSKGSILQNCYAAYLSAYYLFRQDLQDFQDFFAFPEERQKPKSLFEGVHWVIKTP